jgi:hypothetical protein
MVAFSSKMIFWRTADMKTRARRLPQVKADLAEEI